MNQANGKNHLFPRQDTSALVCMLGAIFCFGGVPVFLRYLTGYLDSWTVNAVRYSTAALFWLPFVLILRRRVNSRRIASPKRSIWIAALVPAIFNTIGQAGWAICPYYAEASTIGFVIRTSFVFTVLFGLLFIPAERVVARRPLFFLGTATSIVGVGLMYLEKLSLGSSAGGTGGVGMSLILGTAVFWGAYAVAVRRFLAGYPLRLAFGVISIYTAGVLIVLALLLGDYRRLTSLHSEAWALLISSAVLGIAFGHVLLHRGIHGLGPLLASGISMVQPFVTYLAAAIFLSESMGIGQWLGGLAVIAGGLMLVKARAQIIRGIALEKLAAGE